MGIWLSSEPGKVKGSEEVPHLSYTVAGTTPSSPTAIRAVGQPFSLLSHMQVQHYSTLSYPTTS